MGKLLEKALKDAVKAGQCTLGARSVEGSVASTKLIVMSRSVRADRSKAIASGAGEAGVPTVRFAGSSVALGRLCGVQFRVSVAALTSAADATVKSIVSETENE